MRAIELCESCIWADNYAEILPDSDSEPLSKIHEGYTISSLPCSDHGVGCMDCDSPSTRQHFDRKCDGCETRYAGTRYDYNLTWEG